MCGSAQDRAIPLRSINREDALTNAGSFSLRSMDLSKALTTYSPGHSRLRGLEILWKPNGSTAS
jgi:hypothetical protein